MPCFEYSEVSEGIAGKLPKDFKNLYLLFVQLIYKNKVIADLGLESGEALLH